MSGGELEVGSALPRRHTDPRGLHRGRCGKIAERDRRVRGVFQISTALPPTPTQLALRSGSEVGGEWT